MKCLQAFKKSGKNSRDILGQGAPNKIFETLEIISEKLHNWIEL